MKKKKLSMRKVKKNMDKIIKKNPAPGYMDGGNKPRRLT